MTIVQFPCPVCKKTTTETSRRVIGKSLVHSLACGHVYASAAAVEVAQDRYVKLRSVTRHDPLYPFQVETCKSLESPECGFRGIIGHEQGLGKSVIIASALRFHPELFPVLCICKASLRYQWERMFSEWTDNRVVCQVIDTGRDPLVPPSCGVGVYVISYDNLDSHWLTLKDFNIKLVILDECQLIKNTNAKRTNNVRRFNDAPHIVALSGTSIKNNAKEYFPILNLLHPEAFYSENAYVQTYVRIYTDSNGVSRYGGLSQYTEKYFRQKTENWIFRKTRDEVDIQLPKINRQPVFFQIDDILKREYDRVMVDLEAFCDENEVDQDNAGRFTSSILGFMAKLRKIVGLAKVEPLLDWIEEFRAAHPDEKLAIFCHHIEVADRLEHALAGGTGEKVIRISDRDNPTQRERKIQEFVQSKGNEIALLRTLAEGEGHNLQVCGHAILAEREFNPANEEQAESRFARIGSSHSSIDVLYPIVVNSFDEWISELVERKRDAMKQTLDGIAETYADSDMVKDLLRIVKQRGGRRWKMEM